MENTRLFRVSVSKTALVLEVPGERSSMTTTEEQKEQKAVEQSVPPSGRVPFGKDERCAPHLCDEWHGEFDRNYDW